MKEVQEDGGVHRVPQAQSLPSICQRENSYRCLMLQTNGSAPTLWIINGLNSIYVLVSPRRIVACSNGGQSTVSETKVITERQADIISFQVPQQGKSICSSPIQLNP